MMGTIMYTELSLAFRNIHFFDGGLFTMPFNPASKTNKNRTAYRNRTRSNHFVSVKPSSVLVQFDESGNSNSPDKNVLSPACTMTAHQTRHQSKTYGSLLSSQGKNTVGIIGGVSVCSTLIFLEKLVWLSSRNGEKECLPFVVCSSDPDLNPEIVVDNLWQKRAFLEQSGARCIVMPCSLSHAWHDEISRGCSVTFLHIGDCVAKELKEANLKPLEAGSNVRIGVLATDETLNAGFYQQKPNLLFQVHSTQYESKCFVLRSLQTSQAKQNKIK